MPKKDGYQIPNIIYENISFVKTSRHSSGSPPLLIQARPSGGGEIDL
jgi:hypothetical protein